MRISHIEATLLFLAAVVVAVVAFRKKPAAPSTAPARLSRLCGMSFFCALLALMAALAAILTADYAAGAGLLGLNKYEVRDLRMATEILRLCALPLALAAFGLAIAGRGAVRESGGELRGAGLCRAATLAALGVGALVWVL
ncbi:MAG TPA: hypothetical protein VF950_02285 [Planctomycetota bacterium]